MAIWWNREREAAASPSESKTALDFANLVLQDPRVTFPPAGVVDVGVVQGRGWAVVEANPGWGTGIYRCDPQSVLRTLARAWVKRAALAEMDRRWVVERSNAIA